MLQHQIEDPPEHHMASNLRGELQRDSDPFDLIF